MRAKLIPLSHCVLNSSPSYSMAVYAGERIDNTRFNADVTALASVFLDLKAEQFALYYEQAYPFCVSLFALLHSHKKVWIAANNTALTADKLSEQGCLLLGDWKGRELSVEQDKANSLKPGLFNFDPLNLDKDSVTLFTSGSGGQAKAVTKSLKQLQTEIETLENYWGQRLGQADVLATVSHQHIYGLLFRVLWPLAGGRCFHSEKYLSPEPLLKHASTLSAYWVASPAQLKRLDELTPWQDISHLRAIFSSGGMLPIESAKQIYKSSNHKVLEIYGSTETGGIAWRQSVDDELWQSFDGINISVDDEGISRLTSPLIERSSIERLSIEQAPFILDDKIQLAENGRFALLGRLDRIVKVEEKRLSLDELEQLLNVSDWIQQSYTLLIAELIVEKRDKIAAVLVLTETGKAFLQQQGRGELIKTLRKQLMQGFESVVLPRKWLFIQSLPLTVQGKINRDLLVQLLSQDTTRFPQILECDYQDEAVDLQLRIPRGLVYFSGHFPEQPILPGVTQLAWVEHFGKLFFDIALPFLRMEVIKFKKIIRPGDIIQMKLNWKTDNNKLYFELSSVSDSHSSGRMVYGEQE